MAVHSFLPWSRGQRRGFETGGPGFDPSSDTKVMMECPWARHIFWPSTGLFTKGSSISELSP